jgi:hypothetical protein
MTWACPFYSILPPISFPGHDQNNIPIKRTLNNLGLHHLLSIYNKTTSFWGRSLCLSRTFWGRSLCLCQHRLLPPKLFGTCPNKSPPDVVARMTQSLMTQQPASPPDVYSIAVMTKSSSTGQISHDKIYYGQIIKLQKSE